MLTADERKLIHNVWRSGPSALTDFNYSHEQVRAFLSREDVQSELLALDAEYKHGPAFEARARYTARKQLAQLAPGASALLALAMRGPLYVRNEKGEIQRDARGFPSLLESEPTTAQLRAAEVVIDAIGG